MHCGIIRILEYAITSFLPHLENEKKCFGNESIRNSASHTTYLVKHKSQIKQNNNFSTRISKSNSTEHKDILTTIRKAVIPVRRMLCGFFTRWRHEWPRWMFIPLWCYLVKGIKSNTKKRLARSHWK